MYGSIFSCGLLWLCMKRVHLILCRSTNTDLILYSIRQAQGLFFIGKSGMILCIVIVWMENLKKLENVVVVLLIPSSFYSSFSWIHFEQFKSRITHKFKSNNKKKILWLSLTCDFGSFSQLLSVQFNYQYFLWWVIWILW